MALMCWLCPSEFETRKHWKVHMTMYPHHRREVVCPLCRKDCTCFNSAIMLKRHFSKVHTKFQGKLPEDFFTHANGYFMALHPIDYKRIHGPSDPSSESAKLAMDLIKQMTTALSQPPKRLSEWKKQWETAQEPPDIPLDYFESSSSRGLLSKAVQKSNNGNNMASKKMPGDSEVLKGKTMNSKASVASSVTTRQSSKSSVSVERASPLRVDQVYEHVGTRSWAAKSTKSQTQITGDTVTPVVAKSTKSQTQVTVDHETATPKVAKSTKSQTQVTVHRETATPKVAKSTKSRTQVTVDRETATHKVAKSTKSRTQVTEDRETATPKVAKSTKSRTQVTEDRETATTKVAKSTKPRTQVTVNRETPTHKEAKSTKSRTQVTADREAATPIVAKAAKSRTQITGDCNTSTPKVTKSTKSRTQVTADRETATPIVTKSTKSRTQVTADRETATPIVTKAAKSRTQVTANRETATPIVAKSTKSQTQITGDRNTSAPIEAKSAKSQTQVTADRETATPIVTKSTKSQMQISGDRETATQIVAKSTKSQTQVTVDRETDTPIVAKSTKSQTQVTTDRETATPIVTKSTKSQMQISGDRETATQIVAKSTKSQTQVTVDRKTDTPIIAKSTKSQTQVTTDRETATPIVAKTAKSQTQVTVDRETATPIVAKSTKSRTIVTVDRETATPAVAKTAKSRTQVNVDHEIATSVARSVASSAPVVVVSPVPSTVVLTPPSTPTPSVATTPSVTTSSTNGQQNKRQLENDGTSDVEIPAKIAKQTFSCTTCWRKFNSAANLRVHKRLHSKLKRFKCARCGKCFQYLSSYSVHIIAAHGSDEPIDIDMEDIEPKTGHKCSICHGIFPTRDEVEEHRLMHKNQPANTMTLPEKSFKCDTCSMSFAEKKGLDSHKPVHAGARFPCPVCGKRFKRIGCVKAHTIRTHRKSLAALASEGIEKAQLLLNVYQRVPRPVVCRICGSRFETFVRLSIHTSRFHKGSREQVHFSCTKCNNAFEEETLLEEHMQSDHGLSTDSSQSLQPSEIPQISKNKNNSTKNAVQPLYPSEENVRIMERVPQRKRFVEDDQLYVCDFCGARFVHRPTLKQHIIIHLSGPDTDKTLAEPHAPEKNTQKTVKSPGMKIVNGIPAKAAKKTVNSSGRKFVNTIPFRLREGYGKLGVQNHEVRVECFGEVVKNAGNNKALYRCKVCYVNYLQQTQLMKHIHDEVDYHVEKFSKRTSDLIYASFSSAQQSKYRACEFCGIFYTSKYNLWSHRFDKHGAMVSRNNEPSRDVAQSVAAVDTDTNRIDGDERSVSQGDIDVPTIEIVREETEIDMFANEVPIVQCQDDYALEINSSDNSEMVSTTCEVPLSQTDMDIVPGIDIVNKSSEVVTTQTEEQSNCQTNAVDTSTSIDAITSSTSVAVHNQVPEDTTLRSYSWYNYAFGTVGTENIVSYPVANQGLETSSLAKLEQQTEPSADTDIGGIPEPASTIIQTNEEISSIVKNDVNEASPVVYPDNSATGISVNNSNTVDQTAATGSEESADKVEARNYGNTFEDNDCNDLNSSDEDSVFGDEANMPPCQNSSINTPVGDNIECIQCLTPFIEGQAAVTCHLCCKRFCLQCSNFSRSVYRKAFCGQSVGLVWMCQVCRPAFPGYVALLRQLAEFEEALNKRLTGVSERVKDIEKNVEAAERDKGELKYNTGNSGAC